MTIMAALGIRAGAGTVKQLLIGIGMVGANTLVLGFHVPAAGTYVARTAQKISYWLQASAAIAEATQALV